MSQAWNALWRYRRRQSRLRHPLWFGLLLAALHRLVLTFGHEPKVATIVVMLGLLAALILPLMPESGQTDFERCLPIPWQRWQASRLLMMWLKSSAIFGPLFVSEMLRCLSSAQPMPNLGCALIALSCMIAWPVLVFLSEPALTADSRTIRLCGLFAVFAAVIAGTWSVPARWQDPWVSFGLVVAAISLAPIACGLRAESESSGTGVMVDEAASVNRKPSLLMRLASRCFPVRLRWLLATWGRLYLMVILTFAYIWFIFSNHNPLMIGIAVVFVGGFIQLSFYGTFTVVIGRGATYLMAAGIPLGICLLVLLACSFSMERTTMLFWLALLTLTMAFPIVPNLPKGQSLRLILLGGFICLPFLVQIAFSIWPPSEAIRALPTGSYVLLVIAFVMTSIGLLVFGMRRSQSCEFFDLESVKAGLPYAAISRAGS